MKRFHGGTQPVPLRYVLLAAAIGLIFLPGQALTVQSIAEPDAHDSATRSLAAYPTVKLEPGTLTIEGRCLDENGGGIQDATVALLYYNYARNIKGYVRREKTDEQGVFSFSGLATPRPAEDGHVSYWVVAWRPGRASKMTSIYPHHPRVIDLVMPRPERLIGRVIDLAGNPVAGAVVRFDFPLMPDAIEGVLSSRTQPDGWFAVTDLSPWKQEDHVRERPGGIREVPSPSFRVQHPDFATASVRYQEIPNQDEIDIVLQPAAAISGVVTYHDGRPAPGVPVRLQGVPDRDQDRENDPTSWAEAVTDEEGRYRLTSLRAGQYNVWPTASGLTAVALDSFEVNAGQSREAPKLLLTGGGFLSGRLIDADTGDNVDLADEEHVSVGIYGPSRPRSGAAIDGGRVEADGSFRFRLPPGRHYVYLSGTGPLTVDGEGRGAHEVEVRAGETTETTFRVRRAAGNR